MRQYAPYNPMLVIGMLNFYGKWSPSQDNLAFHITSCEDNLNTYSKALLQALRQAMVFGWTTEEEYREIGRIDGVLSGSEANDAEVANSLEKSLSTPEEAPYASQMDNEFKGEQIYGEAAASKVVKNYNTCNVTSLAMALRAIKPEHQLRSTLLFQLSEGGYSQEQTETIKGQDIEDLIIYRFQQVGAVHWQNIVRKAYNNPKFTFGKGKHSVLPHQYGVCLAEMGSLLIKELDNFITSANGNSEKDLKKYFVNEVKPKLKLGTEIVISTKLTSGGHIVYLLDINEGGLVLNDPYGLHAGEGAGYLINGASLNQKRLGYLKNKIKTNIKTRLKYNQAAYDKFVKLEEAKEGTIPENAGEMNFYPWLEVKTFNIGKWMLGLTKKSKNEIQ